MRELEYIELSHAKISERYLSISASTGNFQRGDDENLLGLILGEMQKIDVPLEEIIYIRNDEKSEIFMTIDKKHRNKLENIEKNTSEKMDIQADLLQVRINGTGFARSHEFVEMIYVAFSDIGINILAQACSDLEILIYCKKDGVSKNISNALGEIGLSILWDTEE